MHLGISRGSYGLHFSIAEVSMIAILEGIDGSGKTTLINELLLHLPSHLTASCSAEPYNLSPFSADPMIATLQFAQARWRHCQWLAESAKHWSDNHVHLIDRFDMSMLAYQGYGDGVDRGLISTLNRHVTQPLTDIFQPCYIYLDVPVEIAVQRVRERGEAVSPAQILRLERVRNGYLEICERGCDDFRSDYAIVIDANQPFEEVYEEVFECITRW
jgi:dTMP kinase